MTEGTGGSDGGGRAGMTEGPGGHDGGARWEGRRGPVGRTEGTGGKDGRGPAGRTEGAGVVVGWSPRRTRLSFPRKRESRGTRRDPGAGLLGVEVRSMSAFGGGEKTLDSR